MRIVIKTLQGNPTQYEVAEGETVAELKRRVASDQKIDIGQIKLIHEGVVLSEDGKSLQAYGVKDNDFLVLMVAKVCPQAPYYSAPRWSARRKKVLMQPQTKNPSAHRRPVLGRSILW